MDFADIYDRYFSGIYNYARYRVGSPSDADDVTARIFEAALAGIGTYNSARGPAQAWLFGIARNTIADWFRARNRHVEVFLEDMSEQAGAEPLPEEFLAGKEENRLLLKAVAALDDRSRDIVALKFGSGMMNRDIAQMTGLGESNVGLILYRAVKKMQAFLAEKGKV
jgi:RNA polymerase sigma-70 factor (ECF subfamily)